MVFRLGPQTVPLLVSLGGGAAVSDTGVGVDHYPMLYKCFGIGRLLSIFSKELLETLNYLITNFTDFLEDGWVGPQKCGL